MAKRILLILRPGIAPLSRCPDGLSRKLLGNCWGRLISRPSLPHGPWEGGKGSRNPEKQPEKRVLINCLSQCRGTGRIRTYNPSVNSRNSFFLPPFARFCLHLLI